MNDFVFLYRGGDAARSPERIQQTLEKWFSWMAVLRENGHLKDPGLALERTGKVVQGKERTVTDGPFTEVKDIIGGYSLIAARDLDQAIELTKGCPIFEDDGTVEVRPVMII